jgi:hypothetical protein
MGTPYTDSLHMLSPCECTYFLIRTGCLPHAIACSVRISETDFRPQPKTLHIQPGEWWFITLCCPLWRIEADTAASFAISSGTEDPTLSPDMSQKVLHADHRNYRQHATLQLKSTHTVYTSWNLSTSDLGNTIVLCWSITKKYGPHRHNTQTLYVQ